jgi:transposase InsO family protein
MSGQDEREEEDGGQRGRPGRRSLQDHQNAVLEVLQRKATVVQIARRLGVRPETVAGWRDAALAGMESARMRGDSRSEPERELERENDTLHDALTRSAIQVELLQRPHPRRPRLGAGVWLPRRGDRRGRAPYRPRPQYTGRDAEELTETWRVTHTFALVGRPTGNAVAERTIRTMNEECMWLIDWRDIDELVAALERWARAFNEDRPHQALGWQTAAERRAALLGPSRRRAA